MHKSVSAIKIFTKPNAYDNPQHNTNTTPTKPSHLHSLHNNHLLSLVSQSFRNTSSTSKRPIHTNKFQRTPISHIALPQPTVDDTSEQSAEQLHALNFRSQNNLLLSTR